MILTANPIVDKNIEKMLVAMEAAILIKKEN